MDSFTKICREVIEAGVSSSQKLYFNDLDKESVFTTLYSIEGNPRSTSTIYIYLDLFSSTDSSEEMVRGYTLDLGGSPMPGQADEFVSCSIEREIAYFQSKGMKHIFQGSLLINRGAFGEISGATSANFKYVRVHPKTGEMISEFTGEQDYSEIGQDLNVKCTKCRGQGRYFEMSIPREDLESGLSGYALYSCNTICCYHGCELCGGKGLRFEKWYKAENPDIKATESELVLGAGRVYFD